MANLGLKKEASNWQSVGKRVSEAMGADIITLKVTMTPGQDLALTNHAYCSQSDYVRLTSREGFTAMVLVGDFMVLNISYPIMCIIACTLILDDSMHCFLDVSQLLTIPAKFLNVSRYTPHEAVLDGQIAMNAIQRRNAKVSAGDFVTVEK